jgi:hypothetical protein
VPPGLSAPAPTSGRTTGTRLWWRDFAQEFGRTFQSRSALGPGVFCTFGLVFALLVLLSVMLSPAPLLPVITGVVFSTAVAIGIGLLGGHFLLPRLPAGARPWAVLGIYAAVGLVRALILGGLSSLFGVSLIILPPRATTVAAIVVMTLAALTANRFREYRVRMLELAELQTQLVTLNDSFADRVEESNDDLIEQVRLYMEPALENIRDLLDRPGDASAEQIAQVLVSTVSDVVRPLTKEIATLPAEDQRPKADEPHSRAVFRLRDARVNTSRALRPAVMLAAIALTLIYRPITIPESGPNTTFLTTVLAVVLLVAIVRKNWPRRLLMQSFPTAVATLVGLFIASAALPGMILNQLMPETLAEAFPYAGAALLFWVLLGLGVSLPSLVEQFAEQSQTAGAEVNLKLELVRARYQRQLWINRRNLTWVLHGPIQSALVSSAMALSLGDDSPAVRERVRVSLASALAQLEGNRMANPDLRLALDDIAAVWSVSCRTFLKMDPRANLLLEDDRDAVRSIAEIVREGVSNAVRHGACTRVTIYIDAPDGQLTGALRIRIVDNGIGLATTAKPGLGSVMLDELTHSWTRLSGPRGTTLTASVPTRVLAC